VVSRIIVDKDCPVRIGAVTYLNTRPLVYSLAQRLPGALITTDHPSRLAADLAAGRLDVATVPSIEYFRNPGSAIVSDACIACHGPVRSVKLYGRRPVRRIRTLGLDEGSRTSAALIRILLVERYGLEPSLLPLPIGASVGNCAADAVLMIGDRGMLPATGAFEFVWDLGEEWSRWTGLPFVFSMWVARPGIELAGLGQALEAARDDGVARLAEIADAAAAEVGLPATECLSYLRDNLHFHLGRREREGLEKFYQLAARHGLAPSGAGLVFQH